MAPKTTTPATSEAQEQPQPPAFDLLAKRFGMTRQDVYALALMEALALQFDHQPRQIAPTTWELDSRSDPGTVRTVTQVEKRLLCDCPAAKGDEATERAPRICTHTASVHLALCHRLGIEPPVRPMPPWVLRLDPAPEARAALALIERPRQAKAPPAKPEARAAARVEVARPDLVEVQR